MEDHEATRILAFAEVLRPRQAEAYALRHVMRWFSEKFSTPYSQVEEMPVEDVLRHYYEVEAEQLVSATQDDDRQAAHAATERLVQVLQDLSMTPRERAAAQAKSELREVRVQELDDKFDREAEEEARKQEAEAAKNPPPPPPRVEDTVQEINFSFGTSQELDAVGELDGLGGVGGGLVGLEKP